MLSRLFKAYTRYEVSENVAQGVLGLLFQRKRNIPPLKIQVSPLKIAPGFSRGKLYFQGVHPLKMDLPPLKITSLKIQFPP
jgi:hypothetical protein